MRAVEYSKIYTKRFDDSWMVIVESFEKKTNLDILYQDNKNDMIFLHALLVYLESSYEGLKLDFYKYIMKTLLINEPEAKDIIKNSALIGLKAYLEALVNSDVTYDELIKVDYTENDISKEDFDDLIDQVIINELGLRKYWNHLWYYPSLRRISKDLNIPYSKILDLYNKANPKTEDLLNE